MSITLAAQDLFMTQSAVSRQIHGLEAALDIKLFECLLAPYDCLTRWFSR
jgi:hypothetical protein